MGADFSHWLKRILRFLMTERQFYMRSHGRVQFVSLSPVTQLCLAIGAFLFFSWVAFTTVNVVFKEQIIAAKERKFIEMRAAYEERLAQMETSYERLNASLVLAQQRFLDETADIEARQAQLEQILMQGGSLSSQLSALKERSGVSRRRAANENGDARGNTLAMRLNDGFSPSQRSRLDLIAAEERQLAQNIESGANPFGPALPTHEVNDIPRRVASLAITQRHIVSAFETATQRHVADMERVIDRTGVERQQMLSSLDLDDSNAAGGPFIGLSSAHAATNKDGREFDQRLERLAKNMHQLTRLHLILQAMPIDTPIAQFKVTSRFGVRSDPFRGRQAFHSGLDLKGPLATPVYATAAGTVVFAGWRGAYGKVVEINHGNGLKTIYGHLSSHSVQVGDRVDYRQMIGRQGSTGRSTGPHLHYEVIYNGVRRDPAKFIEAGKYVFKNQG
jgi:murein DD-endopeptidase MepM/ murein hydrolase activator NlpD